MNDVWTNSDFEAVDKRGKMWSTTFSRQWLFIIEAKLCRASAKLSMRSFEEPVVDRKKFAKYVSVCCARVKAVTEHKESSTSKSHRLEKIVDNIWSRVSAAWDGCSKFLPGKFWWFSGSQFPISCCKMITSCYEWLSTLKMLTNDSWFGLTLNINMTQPIILLGYNEYYILVNH